MIVFVNKFELNIKQV